jgi:hypothetical protein
MLDFEKQLSSVELVTYISMDPAYYDGEAHKIVKLSL